MLREFRPATSRHGEQERLRALGHKCHQGEEGKYQQRCARGAASHIVVTREQQLPHGAYGVCVYIVVLSPWFIASVLPSSPPGYTRGIIAIPRRCESNSRAMPPESEGP